jgi:hypothetical protein
MNLNGSESEYGSEFEYDSKLRGSESESGSGFNVEICI